MGTLNCSTQPKHRNTHICTHFNRAPLNNTTHSDGSGQMLQSRCCEQRSLLPEELLKQHHGSFSLWTPPETIRVIVRYQCCKYCMRASQKRRFAPRSCYKLSNKVLSTQCCSFRDCSQTSTVMQKLFTSLQFFNIRITPRQQNAGSPLVFFVNRQSDGLPDNEISRNTTYDVIMAARHWTPREPMSKMPANHQHLLSGL